MTLGSKARKAKERELQNAENAEIQMFTRMDRLDDEFSRGAGTAPPA